MNSPWIVTCFDKEDDGKVYPHHPMVFSTQKEADAWVQEQKKKYWESTGKYDDRWDDNRSDDGYEDFVLGGFGVFRQWNIWEPR